MSLFSKFIPESKTTLDPYLVSIVDNLNNVLNTKKGYGAMLPDLGIDDLNKFGSRAHIANEIIKEVKHNIKNYEPRVDLIDVSVEKSNNPFVLSFTIECKVKKNMQALHMIFDTFFNKFYVKDSWD